MDRFSGLDPDSARAARLRELAAALSIDAPAGRLDAVEHALHDDVEVWQATAAGRRLGKRELLAGMRALGKALRGYRYTDIERVFHADGYVQTHVLRGTARDGTEVEAPAALWVDVRDGSVIAVREYLDSAAVAPLFRAPTPRPGVARADGA